VRLTEEKNGTALFWIGEIAGGSASPNRANDLGGLKASAPVEYVGASASDR
jgi:hypothetical protein